MSELNPIELPGAIAIIGMAGRFPHAKNLEEYWQNLIDGKEVVTFYSEEELIAAGIDPELVSNPSYVPARATLEDAEYFDAGFFGYSPREAEVIDPQQRMFLECVWEALENAGYVPDGFRGAIGVYGGVSMNQYMLSNLMTNPEVFISSGGYQMMISNDKDFLTTRVSYKLNLKGPSVNVQTACSTSLVAIQMACQSLLTCQCDLAIAGGVSVGSPRKSGYLYQPGMIMSPDGHCRAFDQNARGIVAGEGVGIVALKRYEDAVKDGDSIHAIIRGSAINNDGALKVGYTAPSVDGQTEAILMAQTMAGVDPGEITYIETHGTGTELGDPIEVSALTQAFRTGTQDKGFCGIGSVKTNMGHLDSAAGVAGLIKTALALEHKMIPPSLHFERPNPGIDFANSPFYVNDRLKEWNTDRLPRRAGVSSFGIGGTNAHAILEEARPLQPGQSKRQHQLLLLSARSDAALNAATQNFKGWLGKNRPDTLADAAFTLQVGRKTFKHRRIAVCSSNAEALSVLETLDSKRVASGQQDGQDMQVVFLFPGQGSQYVRMGHDLYETEPFFREQFERCVEILKPHLGLDLRSIFYPAAGETQRAEELIGQTWITQPALFTMEYSLAKLWMSWGIQPKAMVGHSIGEYVAACLAGVFTLEDGLALVAARGKMMQSLPSGSMLSIPLPETDILPLLGNDLSLAVINAPKMCVVSGPHEAIDRLQADLTSRGVACRKLHTSHAFHSVMMDPILAPFTELVKEVPLHAPQIPYLSNLSGGWITREQATDPSYWASHLRSTVRFSQNAEMLFKNPSIFLEVGPGQALASLARQHTQKPANQTILSSMRHPQEQTSDALFITHVLGKLWLAGAQIDWQAYHSGEILHRIPLPTYPFEHKRYWIEPKQGGMGLQAEGKKPLAKRKDLSTWFYRPSWQRSTWPAPAALPQPQTWLVFADTQGVSEGLIERLDPEGNVVVTVQPGDSFSQPGEREYRLRPDNEQDYTKLLRELSDHGLAPTRMMHLWTLTQTPEHTLEELKSIQSMGFYSLMALAKALGGRESQNPVEILVVTNQLNEVTGGETLNAAKALLLGPCQVIPQEYANVSCRCVDVILPAHPDGAFLRQIIGEFDLRAPGEVVVAHRGSYRWVQTYVPASIPEAPSTHSNLREQGVYLITGGYGGIGLVLAKYLAVSVHAKLALVGRSGLPERSAWQDWLDTHEAKDAASQKIRAIQELEDCGASVLLLKADVADPVQMKSAIDTVKAQFGSINGVIHAAGLPAGGIIQLKTGDQAATILSPKVQGAWVLGRLTENETLDFFMLCSSVNAVFGGAGQVDYSAANAFLDAFAVMKNAGAKRSTFISVNWAAWQDIGMAFNTEVPAHLQYLKTENLRNGIHPSEGVEAFRRILANPDAQIVVSPVDLQGLLDLSRKPQGQTGQESSASGESSRPGQTASSQNLNTRPDLPSAYVPPANDIEKQLISIWQTLIGVEPIGIQDNFFELGGHSLMATQILARIRDLYKIELPLRVLFEANTIEALGKQISATLWIANNQAPSDEASADREEFSL